MRGCRLRSNRVTALGASIGGGGTEIVATVEARPLLLTRAAQNHNCKIRNENRHAKNHKGRYRPRHNWWSF